MKYHITDEGPKPCHAKTNNCMYGETYDNETIAYKDFEKEYGNKTFPKTVSKRNKYLTPLHIKPAENFDKKIGEMKETLGSLNLSRKDYSEIMEYYSTILKSETPVSVPEVLTHYTEDGFSRDQHSAAYYIHSSLCEFGMYAKVTQKFVKSLAPNIGDGVVLDPMAGKGFLVKALRENGVKSIASDNNSWNISKNIENLDVLESIEKYGDKVSHVVLSWAPYTSDLDVQVLRLVRDKYPHITIINIGEGVGGCTGSERFWDEAKFIEPEHEVEYENTIGINDFVVFAK